jgi:cell division protein FtsQ
VQTAGHFALVDASGVQFRTVTARPAALPLFVVASGAQAQPTAQSAAAVAAALPASVRAKVASIHVPQADAVTLVLADHRVVHWGSAQRSADKARILPALLAQPGTEFDLTDPDQPFAR